MLLKWNKGHRRYLGLYILVLWGLFVILAGFDFRPAWVLWGGFLSGLLLVMWAVAIMRQDAKDSLEWQKEQRDFWTRLYNSPPIERRSEPENLE